MDLVEQIITIYENYGFETEIIVASVRNPLHVLEAALLGADIATIPFKTILQLIKHPLTDRGIEQFLNYLLGEFPSTAMGQQNMFIFRYGDRACWFNKIA